MIEERLKGFSLAELKTIGKRIGLNVDNYKKEELIEEIADAYEEDKIEKQFATNLAMQIKSKKFSLINEIDDFVLDQDDVELSNDESSNKKTKMQLILRDPFWAFAYWSFSKKDAALVRTSNDSISNCLFLRVFKYEQGEAKSISDRNNINTDFFDIPIELSDNKWYINLPTIGVSYYCELSLTLADSTTTVLAKSNIINSPALYFDSKYKSNIDDAIINSGIYQSILSPENIEEDIVIKSHSLLSAGEEDIESEQKENK